MPPNTLMQVTRIGLCPEQRGAKEALPPELPQCATGHAVQVKESDIAEHVRQRLAKDKAEKERRRKEKMEAHLFINVRVATEDDMRKQIGTSVTFDLVDFEKVGSAYASCVGLSPSRWFTTVDPLAWRHHGPLVSGSS